MSQRQRFARVSGTLLLLFGAYVCNSQAKQRQESTPPAVDWRNLTSKIQAALDASELRCYEERTWIDIVQVGDVTGDGFPEALVEYCHLGAYTSSVELMLLERGQPIPARLRDQKGKIVQRSFLRGASVRNGENTGLIPDKHAVYGIHWHTDDSGELESCSVDAYVWDPKRKTFDENEQVSKEIAQRECGKLRKELECEANPCSKETH